MAGFIGAFSHRFVKDNFDKWMEPYRAKAQMETNHRHVEGWVLSKFDAWPMRCLFWLLLTAGMEWASFTYLAELPRYAPIEAGMPILLFLLGMAVVIPFLAHFLIKWIFPKAATAPAHVPLATGQSYETKHVMPTGEDKTKKAKETHGSAFFLSDKEKDESTHHGMGLWLGGGLFNHSEGNLMTFAEPGGGKGAALIVPNLTFQRPYLHSLVVYDPKGTNACITAGYQQSIGQKVIILDPAGVQAKLGAKHGIAPSRFNPLDWLDKDNLRTGCNWIGNVMVPDDPKADKFWNTHGRHFIASTLLHFMTWPEFEGKRNLVEWYKYLRNNPWEWIIQEMLSNTEEDGAVRLLANQFQEMRSSTTNLFGSIRAAADQGMDWIGNKEFFKTLEASDFSPYDIDKGGQTIYLTVPEDHEEQYAIWLKLVIGSIFHANMKPSPQPKEWCYYLLDEFPSMKSFPGIFDVTAKGRERKIRVWMFCQNLPQLQFHYNEVGAKILMGNCGITQAFHTIDLTTAKHISERLGKYTEVFIPKNLSWQQSDSISNGSKSYNSSKSESFTENRVARDLLDPAEVLAEPHIITLIGPNRMRLKKWMYHQRPATRLENYYHERMSVNAAANPNYGQ